MFPDLVPAVVARMKQRLAAEADAATAGNLWMATKVLLGLRYGPRLIDQLLQGVRGMKESTIYQAIVEEGQLQAVREDIRRLDAKRFHGPTPAQVQTALEGIPDLEQLRRLLDRVVELRSWDELLAPPTEPARPKRKRRK